MERKHRDTQYVGWCHKCDCEHEFADECPARINTLIIEVASPPIINTKGQRACFVHWYNENFPDGVHFHRSQIFYNYRPQPGDGEIIYISGRDELEAACKKAGWPDPPCNGRHKGWRCPARVYDTSNPEPKEKS